MAAGSLLALLDDIATILDDVSVMTKVAAKKTAGVLGDDLALNAQQVTGVDASREIPVVWAVAKGSFINKLILVPAALAISYFIPWLITPLLMIGGAYLCFEGFEKIAHKLLHSKHEDKAHKNELAQAVADPKVDLVALEKDKIKGAIRTDFILSAEIIVIALGTVATATFSKQVAVVSLIALVMTVGVYGLVAGIVKLDDLGLYMMMRKGKSIFKQLVRKVGTWLLNLTPYLMYFLSIVGTIAMFWVGGGIIGHDISTIHELNNYIDESLNHLNFWGSILSFLLTTMVSVTLGLIVGAICVALFTIYTKIMPQKQPA